LRGQQRAARRRLALQPPLEPSFVDEVDRVSRAATVGLQQGSEIGHAAALTRAPRACKKAREAKLPRQYCFNGCR
jgi:hypothetical protein